MAVEAPILDREERLADVRRQFSGVDGLTDDRPAPRDRGAVPGEQRDRGRGRRFERLGTWRVAREPGDDQHQQDDAPPLPAYDPPQIVTASGTERVCQSV